MCNMPRPGGEYRNCGLWVRTQSFRYFAPFASHLAFFANSHSYLKTPRHVSCLLRTSARLLSRMPALPHSHRHRSTPFTDIQDMMMSTCHIIWSIGFAFAHGRCNWRSSPAYIRAVYVFLSFSFVIGCWRYTRDAMWNLFMLYELIIPIVFCI